MGPEPVFGVRHTMTTRLASMRRVVDIQKCSGFRVLEVGSYEGASALAWSQAVAELCGGGIVLCIDPWRPYVTAENILAQPICQKINDDLESGMVFDRFVSNIKLAPVSAPISYMVGTLWSSYIQLPLRSFDVVYIDGDHVYDQVRQDIILGQDLVKVGGILCGDDLERQLKDCDLEQVKAWKNLDWMGYHPGVTLAVGEIFNIVWVEDGFWAMRKTATGWEPFA